MKLLSTITTTLLSVALATAAEVGAPILARQGCSITMFTGTGFTGTSETFNGDVCVSAYHLCTALKAGSNIRTSINDWFPSCIIEFRARSIRQQPPLRESFSGVRLLPLHWQQLRQLCCVRR